MRRIELRGFPVLVAIVVLGAAVALVVSLSIAVVLPVAAFLLVLGLLRAAWHRLSGRPAPPPSPPIQVITFRTGHWSAGPGGPEGDGEGPIVDALPSDASPQPPLPGRDQNDPGA